MCFIDGMRIFYRTAQFIGLLAFLLASLSVASVVQSNDGFIFQPLSSGKALPGTQPDSHASTLVELKNGDVLAAWFTGTAEGALNVVIRGARLHHGKWSAPFELARENNIACWNPVLFHARDGKLWLYYKFGKNPSTWEGARKWSNNEGKTWSDEERLPAGILGPIKDKPLLLSSGTIVSGSSVETIAERNHQTVNDKWTVYIERSTDDGKSWSKSAAIVLPDAVDIPGAEAMAHSHVNRTVGIIQPTIVQMDAKHLRFYARTQAKASHIAASDSYDDGITWSTPHFIDLPNPNSGIDSVGMRDGRVVMIFNNSYDQRTPLNLAVSRDGEHFHIFKTLEDAAGQYSYPAIIQAKNGDLLMTYSWKRQTITFVRVPLAEVPQP